MASLGSDSRADKESAASVVNMSETKVPVAEVVAEAEVSESKDPEAEVSESKDPEAKVPEAELSEAVVPEAKVSESKVSEAEFPEAVVPESKVSKVPETEVPETEVPETEVPETEVPETEVPETEIPETATKVSDTEVDDANMDEIKVSETVVSDTNVSDTNVSDTNVSDTNVSDTEVSDTNVSESNVSDPEVSETNVSDAKVSETNQTPSDETAETPSDKTAETPKESDKSQMLARERKFEEAKEILKSLKSKIYKRLYLLTDQIDDIRVEFEKMNHYLSTSPGDLHDTKWRLLTEKSKMFKRTYDMGEICVCVLEVNHLQHDYGRAQRQYDFSKLFNDVLSKYSLVEEVYSMGNCYVLVTVQKMHKIYKHFSHMCMATIDTMNKVKAADLKIALCMAITTTIKGLPHAMENLSRLKFETGKIVLCPITGHMMEVMNVRLGDGFRKTKYLELNDESGEELIFDNQDPKKIVPRDNTRPYDDIRYWSQYTRTRYF